MPLPVHLTIKEIWRNKSRFLLISLIIALITTLVLFIAGLAEGLGSGQSEYIEKLEADVLVLQENIELSIPASRVGRSLVNDVRRIPGVQAVGQIGFTNSGIVADTVTGARAEPVDIALIGVEPGKPGEPEVLAGHRLSGSRVKEAIIDQNLAEQTGLKPGDQFTIKSVQGALEQFYTLTVVGLTTGRRYAINSSVIVPFLTWEEIRPKASVEENGSDITSNVIAVKFEETADFNLVVAQIRDRVAGVEVADLTTAYEALPGYGPQQSTLTTQRIFTLLIGLLVVGGFFQIQTLQKVALVGMLKAIGASNLTVIVTSMIQIMVITIFGVAVGSLGTWLLALNFPIMIPITFSRTTIAITISTLLLIGPVAGLISVRTLLKVEPLTALGLAQ